MLARNAIILPLSVDGGDLTTLYMPTVIFGNSIMGSYIRSRYPQYVPSLDVLGGELTRHRSKMLDFAARHQIYSIVEKYAMTLESVTEAANRLRDGKMRYRAVLSWVA